MANYSEEEDNKLMAEKPLLGKNSTHEEKGGFRTLPFVIGNDAMEKIATFGITPNMTLYLMNEYHMEMTTASSLLFIWSAATNFTPIIGAIIADSFLGRFYTIGFGSVISLLGMMLLWSTTIIPQARPPPCDQLTNTCIPPSISQSAYLCAALGLISVGVGGIRSSSLAFSANQLERGCSNKRSSVKESFFSWYSAIYNISSLIGLTCVVYIQDNLGWATGFAVPAVVMMCGVCSFFLASPFYVKLESKSCLITGFIQVVVASFKNRHLKFSDSTTYVYLCKNGSTLVLPSSKHKFLNKACIVRDAHKDLTVDGEAKDPWTLCTVDQVEEFKALIKVIPIWFSGMIMAINVSQNSFPLLQAVSMDRHITSKFSIPAATFSMFIVVAVILWVVLYNRMFLPLASRFMKRQVHITSIRRMGMGMFFSFLAMIVSATVESIRRSLAIKQGFLDLPQVSSKMSALWLVPQNCLLGFAEAVNSIAQNEFYFMEFPRSMSSIATCLVGIGMSAANLMASLIMNIIDRISKAGGRESWISSNINKGHYDYYYLVLAGLSVANMIYFLVCSSAYGPLKAKTKMEEQEDDE